MKKRDIRIYIVEPVEVYNQREGRCLRGEQGRQWQMHRAKRQRGNTVLISRRKRSPRFSFVCSRKRLCIRYYAKRKHLWAAYGGFGGRSRLRLRGNWFSFVCERGDEKGKSSRKISLSFLTSFIFILSLLLFNYLIVKRRSAKD